MILRKRPRLPKSAAMRFARCWHPPAIRTPVLSEQHTIGSSTGHVGFRRSLWSDFGCGREEAPSRVAKSKGCIVVAESAATALSVSDPGRVLFRRVHHTKRGTFFPYHIADLAIPSPSAAQTWLTFSGFPGFCI